MLDLRALEARLKVALTTGDRSYDHHIQADQRTLLAYCRALRAALRDAPVPMGYSWNDVRARVLAAARDGEAP